VKIQPDRNSLKTYLSLQQLSSANDDSGSQCQSSSSGMLSSSIEQQVRDSSSIVDPQQTSEILVDTSSPVELQDPLHNREVLELTLSYLQGEGLFVITVSKRWKACFEKLSKASSTNHSKHVHSSTCTAMAAAFASPSRVRLAHDAGFQLQAAGWKLQDCAGKHCSVETLEVAYTLALIWNANLSRAAAEAANLPVLQWLHTEQTLPLPDGIAANAARGGSVDVLRWMKQQQCVFDADTTYYGGIKANNLPVLQYLYAEGVPWHESVCGAAAAACDLQQLKWLRSKGARLSSRVAIDAASGGSVVIFEWLQQHGVQFNLQTMLQAAENGHTELCQWLRAADCEWNAEVCDVAAAYAHVDTLRWLHDSGCAFRPETVCYNAVLGCTATLDARAISMMQYLLQPDVLSADEVSLLLNFAGAKSKLQLAQWLRQHGAEWPEVLWSPELGPWNGESLMWARNEGCDAPLEPNYDTDSIYDTDDSTSDSDDEQ
jgi:hypothetical protein